MKLKFLVSAFLSFILTIGHAEAAGFIENLNGLPYSWKPAGSDITYRVDPGAVSLGMTGINNAQGKVIVQQSFQVWEDAPLSTGIAFNEGANLPVDVTQSNYQDYIRLRTDGTFENLTNDTVIIFDADAGIFEDLVGIGNASTILGVASPGKFDDANLKIEAGFAIINGEAVGADQIQLQGTLTHEFGHLLNLSHTQLNTEEAFNNDDADDIFVPTMFPFLPDDPSVLLDLHADDIFSMSILYPDATAISNRSKIEGELRFRDGEGARGVNVICRTSANPRESAVSWVSDIFLQDNGSYSCGNLDSGNHTVEIESIFLAINSFTPNPPHIPSEFFNNDEGFLSSSDLLSSVDSVVLPSSGTVSDIDILINEDGRLKSGVTATGKTIGKYAEYGYFLQVPSDADSLEIEVNFPNAQNADLDLHLKCDDPFSLTAGSTAPEINDQASVSSSGQNTTSEKITLRSDGAGERKLQDCKYHIMVNNFDENINSSVERPFEIIATVQASRPKLTVQQESSGINTKVNGKVWASTLKLISKNDDFSWTGGSLVDQGLDSLQFINRAFIYKEEGSNDVFDEGDDLLVFETNVINLSTKSFAIDSIDEFIEKNETETFYVVYEFQGIPSAAKFSWLILLLIASYLLLIKRLKRKNVFILTLLCILISCQSSGARRYDPQFETSNAINILSLTFGENFDIDVTGFEITSVEEFFTK